MHGAVREIEPHPPLPLLVTGIAGVAGYNAFHHFFRRYPGQVVGLRRKDNWRLSGPGIIGCNMDDRDRLVELFEKHRFAAVLNAEGTCALKPCELDPQMAWRVNVLGIENLLDLVSRYHCRLVHLSIDLVFSGTGGGGYDEDAPTDPITVYGKTMVQAEKLVSHECPSACILRISLPMGVSFNGHAGAIDWIQSRFKQDKPATLYYDEVRTPTYTDCMQTVFGHVLATDLHGAFHAGGPRRLSLYQIAQTVNRMGGYPPDLLFGCPRKDAGPMPPRAGNVTMVSDKLADALGYDPFVAWPLRDEWVPTDREWHYRRDAFEGTPELLAKVLYQRPAANLFLS
ncbi:MAG TPA: NAD-dependent epimerase/dehydratase family protein [Planctomycetes bacterium]|nr:NAD-dependent epimerase/dehydratase family protein [Planctomycetaceae bacterium]HIM28760.1 NAD-dependent epimerase/dehydratase family protein [Planctomycetota bacterium]